MKYLTAKMFLGVICALFLAGPTSTGSPAYDAGTVLSDQQLMEWARDTYGRGDWIYAAIHMNALVQRNPPLLRDNPSLANQVNEGLKYSIQRLQEYKANSDACTKRASTSNGVASVNSGLSAQPPRVDFPR